MSNIISAIKPVQFVLYVQLLRFQHIKARRAGGVDVVRDVLALEFCRSALDFKTKRSLCSSTGAPLSFGQGRRLDGTFMRRSQTEEVSLLCVYLGFICSKRGSDIWSNTDLPNEPLSLARQRTFPNFSPSFIVVN